MNESREPSDPTATPGKAVLAGRTRRRVILLVVVLSVIAVLVVTVDDGRMLSQLLRAALHGLRAIGKLL